MKQNETMEKMRALIEAKKSENAQKQSFKGDQFKGKISQGRKKGFNTKKSGGLFDK